MKSRDDLKEIIRRYPTVVEQHKLKNTVIKLFVLKIGCCD
jgi:hypothetical protein